MGGALLPKICSTFWHGGFDRKVSAFLSGKISRISQASQTLAGPQKWKAGRNQGRTWQRPGDGSWASEDKESD